MGGFVPAERWKAGVTVGIAAVMLIAGQTVLKPYLQKLWFIAYWLVCMALTLLAMMFALIDLHRIRQRIRHEQRELIEGAAAESSECDSRQ